jgi:hypothetical protein
LEKIKTYKTFAAGDPINDRTVSGNRTMEEKKPVSYVVPIVLGVVAFSFYVLSILMQILNNGAGS